MSAHRLSTALVAALVLLGLALPATAGDRLPRCGRITPAELEEARDRLLEAVEAAAPDGADVTVRDVALQGCKRLPARYARVDTEPLVGGRLGTQVRALLRLVDAGGRTAGQVWLTLTLDVRVPVVVAARTLAPDTTIGLDDVLLARVPLTSAQRSVATVDAAVGLVTRRVIPKGEPLLPAAVTRPLLVRRGEVVTAEVRRGALAVSGSGLALEDGRLGETVRLRTPDRSRTFSGRVTGEGRVDVSP